MSVEFWEQVNAASWQTASYLWLCGWIAFAVWCWRRRRGL